MASRHSSFPLNFVLNYGSMSTCKTRACPTGLGTIKRSSSFACDGYLFPVYSELGFAETGNYWKVAYLCGKSGSFGSEFGFFEDCTDKQGRYRRGVLDCFCGSTLGFGLQGQGHLTESCLQRHALKRIFWWRSTGHQAAIVLKRRTVPGDQFKRAANQNTRLNVCSRSKAFNTSAGLSPDALSVIHRWFLRLRTAVFANWEAA